MSSTNRPTTEAHDAQIILGIKKDLQNVSSLPLAGTTYTMTALEQLIQSRIDAANAAVNARANWLHASATYNALNAQVTPVVRALRQYAINAFGQNSPTLADFGFAPPKTATLTPEDKAKRVAKALATRKARGTLGKKQKAAIKGTVPTTAPATPPSPAPAPTTAAPSVTAAPTGTVAPTGATAPSRPQ
jgi:hypothetical protein